MKKMVLTIAVFVLGISAAACAGLPSYPSGSWKYKMTVTVETPEGLKSGSAVREISAYSRPEMLAEGNDAHINLVKGEAVVVDLGQRGVLFATLGSANESVWTFLNAFPSPCVEGAVSRCSIKYYSSLKFGEKAQLAVRDYPMLVTFEDLNDPKSARNILEMKSCADPKTGIRNDSRCVEKDRFEEFFGQGVQLKSISVEVTDQHFLPVVGQFLKWLNQVYGYQLDGSRFHIRGSKYPVANSLSAGSFSTEVGEK